MSAWKVFLVEDEKVMREGIKRKIQWEKEGLEFVGDAGDGELAYPMIIQKRPDILITDIRMPFMDGLELSRLVKKELPDLKIIILSGYDEFEYAQEAINIGITEYLLKPVTSAQLVETLRKVSNIIQEERKQKGTDSLYETDAQKIEQQRFLNKVIRGNMSVAEVLNESKKVGLDLVAERYNILLLQMFWKDGESDLNELIEKTTLCIENYSKMHQQIVWKQQNNRSEFLILIFEEDEAGIDERVLEITALLEEMSYAEYFGAMGSCVCRLSEIKKCYEEADSVFAHRYLKEHQQVVRYGKLVEEVDFFPDNLMKAEQLELENLSGSQVEWKELEQFLYAGTKDDVQNFVQQYIQRVGDENLSSILFRQYFLLDSYMAALTMLEKIGVTSKEFAERNGKMQQMENAMKTVEEARVYIEELLKTAIELREMHSEKKYDVLIHGAQRYIEQNYGNEDISLNVVAQAVNVSPNHFSAVFSQETGQTFVEYLTDVRMRKAEQLLRTSNMKITDVAFAVGYRDPHYFSTLFKKIQGCTPKEYRKLEM